MTDFAEGGPMPSAVPLERLHGWSRNPRNIKDARFLNLCKSIEADPGLLWLRPVLAMADGTVYAGNQRLKAVAHLGWPTVPAIIEDVTEAVAHERAIRDNQQWGDWERDELARLLEEMGQAGSDLDILGFQQIEVERLLALVGAGAGAEEEGFDYHEMYGVTVMCKDAADQEKIYDKLRGQGYECRVVVV